jgi:hypothetical protein
MRGRGCYSRRHRAALQAKSLARSFVATDPSSAAPALVAAVAGHLMDRLRITLPDAPAACDASRVPPLAMLRGLWALGSLSYGSPTVAISAASAASASAPASAAGGTDAAHSKGAAPSVSAASPAPPGSSCFEPEVGAALERLFATDDVATSELEALRAALDALKVPLS